MRRLLVIVPVIALASAPSSAPVRAQGDGMSSLERARAKDGATLAAVLRAAERSKHATFKVQSIARAEIEGQPGVEICYWLGDVRRVPDEATCGIRLVADPGTGALKPGEGTRRLAEGLLAGERPFFDALGEEFRDVCGEARERRRREC